MEEKKKEGLKRIYEVRYGTVKGVLASDGARYVIRLDKLYYSDSDNTWKKTQWFRPSDFTAVQLVISDLIREYYNKKQDKEKEEEL